MPIERSLTADDALSTAYRALAELNVFAEITTNPKSEAMAPDTTCRLVRASGGDIATGRGKGRGLQATASAVFEAIEHAVVQNEPPFDGTSKPTVEASAGLKASWITECDALYASSVEAATDLDVLRFDQVDDDSIALYPAIAVDFAYPLPAAGPLRRIGRYLSSNGYAAGATRTEAALHGLLEVIERDALSAAMLACAQGRPIGTSLHAADLGLGDLNDLVRRHIGHTPTLVLVPSLAAQVVIALSDNVDSSSRRIIGAGASLDLTYAAEERCSKSTKNTSPTTSRRLKTTMAT